MASSIVKPLVLIFQTLNTGQLLSEWKTDNLMLCRCLKIKVRRSKLQVTEQLVSPLLFAN